MLRTSCHCGAIQVEVASRPDSLTECNCSICRRYGARWAYYSRKSTRIAMAEGALERYSPGKDLSFDRCATCGCIVRWEPIMSRGDEDRVGINMRLIENPDDLANIQIRRFDGARTWQTAAYCTLAEPHW